MIFLRFCNFRCQKAREPTHKNNYYSRNEYKVEKHTFFEALRSFDVRQSACQNTFDDEFINSAIIAWYGSVDEFNNHVRTTVLGSLTTLRGSAQLPYSYAAFTCFPVFCNYSDGLQVHLTVVNRSLQFVSERPVTCATICSSYPPCFGCRSSYAMNFEPKWAKDASVVFSKAL